MDRRILVVDDSAVNRAMLRKFLSGTYDVLEAENGKEALDTLAREPVDGILLDVMMPVMDGYTFLSHIRRDQKFAGLPVVVMTADNAAASEIEALELGAWDFVSKPFDPTILSFRLHNAIERSQLAAFQQVKRLAEFDPLTGIHNKRTFYLAVSDMLKKHRNTRYAFVRFDIDHFKVYNDIYGPAGGDALLSAIGSLCANWQRASGDTAAFGYLEADHFAVCMPESALDADELVSSLRDFLAAYQAEFTFTPRFGVCEVDDPDAEIGQICNHALLALRTLKGKYGAYIAYYDASMRETMLGEQKIIGEMAGALAAGQFDIYLQPQYNHASGDLLGAEALVRWFHPVNGMVPPGAFIPVFERNGFIAKLDEFVWERACQMLRKWLDMGLEPVPVSVNISRIDIYNPRLCDMLVGLLSKYSVPASLLRLEITESAYVDNPVQLIDVVSRLRSAGFYLEMDDFGSGYSSLNSLKDVPVDLVKLDMRFLSSENANDRGDVVLYSVVRMMQRLDLDVMAEGVETRTQADYLRSIGCEMVQGYLYARPMSASAFEELLRLNKQAKSQ